MQIFEFFLYAFSAIIFFTVGYLFIRRSEFGVLVFFSEFIFFWLGACIYPMLYYLDIVQASSVGLSYMAFNGEPGMFSALHIAIYCLSAFFGYELSKNNNNEYRSILSRFAKNSFKRPMLLFRALVIFGIVVYSLFFFIVGFDVALINSAAARSGIMDGFGDDAKYLFLKTLASASLLSTCFIPWILSVRKSTTDKFFLLLYFVLVIFGYVNSISRSLLLSSLIVPYFVYMRAHIDLKLLFRISPVVVFAFVVLIYGKPFGHYMSSYLGGREATLNAYNSEDGVIVAIFKNVDFIWFSVAAGIKNFFNNGILVPQDVFMAIYGFVPSRVLSFLSVGELYYGASEVRLACVNTDIFGLEGCTIPPLWSGYSAYFMPLAGGAIFGFLKFFIFKKIETMWIYAKNNDYSLTYVPYFLFVFTSMLMSMVPTAVAHNTFIFFVLAGFVMLRCILLAAQKCLLKVRRFYD